MERGRQQNASRAGGYLAALAGDWVGDLVVAHVRRRPQAELPLRACAGTSTRCVVKRDAINRDVIVNEMFAKEM